MYEGLLEFSVREIHGPYVGLRDKPEPELPLERVEEVHSEGERVFLDWLQKETGATRKQVEKMLVAEEGGHSEAKVAQGNHDFARSPFVVYQVKAPDEFGPMPLLLGDDRVILRMPSLVPGVPGGGEEGATSGSRLATSGQERRVATVRKVPVWEASRGLAIIDPVLLTDFRWLFPF